MTWTLHGILSGGTALGWENLATNPPQPGAALAWLRESRPDRADLAKAVNHFGGHARSIFALNSLSELSALHAAALAVHDLVPLPRISSALSVLTGQIARTAQELNVIENREWAEPVNSPSPELDVARRVFLQATEGCLSEVARLEAAINLFLAAVEEEWLAA